jgi:GNAT superfamily N-acetyltransferase
VAIHSGNDPSLVLEPALASDADAIAALHADSWRRTYRGMLPDSFLDDEVAADRAALWKSRFADPAPERRLILKATRERALLGFVCVMLDVEPAWGARLDNLHVDARCKGEGIGYVLFQAARRWTAEVAPGQPVHLWVLEQNTGACAFYDRQGGEVVEKAVRTLVPGCPVPELRYLWPPLREP